MRYCHQCSVNNKWPWPKSRLTLESALPPVFCECCWALSRCVDTPNAKIVAATGDDLTGNHAVHGAIVVSMIAQLLKNLPDGMRLQVMCHFCQHCGTESLPCSCWNDE